MYTKPIFVYLKIYVFHAFNLIERFCENMIHDSFPLLDDSPGISRGKQAAWIRLYIDCSTTLVASEVSDKYAKMLAKATATAT